VPGRALADDADRRPAETLLLAVCVVYPFRLFLNAFVGADLHLGLVCFAIVGALALATVRERPAAFPTALDVAVLLFVGIAIVDLLVVTKATQQAVKGLSVETRFAVFYFVARLFALRKPFADRLFLAAATIGIVAAIVGCVEHHLSWGAILDFTGTTPDRRFWKVGMARLYSFPMSPLAVSYLLLLALIAAAYFTFERRHRWLAIVTVLAVWQALPLTLTRTALVLAVAIAAMLVLFDWRRGLELCALSAAGMVGSLAVLAARGWHTKLLKYLLFGARLADGSARAHMSSSKVGWRLIFDQPFGYGLGEGGHVAMARGGAFPFDDTFYVTLGVQMGVPGLLCFLVVIGLAGGLWLRLATARQPEERHQRNLGFAGSATWIVLFTGGLFVAAWNMLVPQLYFWLLTGVAVNVLAENARGADAREPESFTEERRRSSA
jgi:hypothetical protein